MMCMYVYMVVGGMGGWGVCDVYVVVVYGGCKGVYIYIYIYMCVCVYVLIYMCVYMSRAAECCATLCTCNTWIQHTIPSTTHNTTHTIPPTHNPHPITQSHPKFASVADLQPLLYSRALQMSDEKLPKRMRLGDAVSQGIIANETLAYFIGRTYLFMVRIGVSDDKLRFRQHLQVCWVLVLVFVVGCCCCFCCWGCSTPAPTNHLKHHLNHLNHHLNHLNHHLNHQPPPQPPSPA